MKKKQAIRLRIGSAANGLAIRRDFGGGVRRGEILPITSKRTDYKNLADERNEFMDEYMSIKNNKLMPPGTLFNKYKKKKSTKAKYNMADVLKNVGNRSGQTANALDSIKFGSKPGSLYMQYTGKNYNNISPNAKMALDNKNDPPINGNTNLTNLINQGTQTLNLKSPKEMEAGAPLPQKNNILDVMGSLNTGMGGTPSGVADQKIADYYDNLRKQIDNFLSRRSSLKSRQAIWQDPTNPAKTTTTSVNGSGTSEQALKVAVNEIIKSRINTKYKNYVKSIPIGTNLETPGTVGTYERGDGIRIGKIDPAVIMHEIGHQIFDKKDKSDPDFAANFLNDFFKAYPYDYPGYIPKTYNNPGTSLMPSYYTDNGMVATEQYGRIAGLLGEPNNNVASLPAPLRKYFDWAN